MNSIRATLLVIPALASLALQSIEPRENKVEIGETSYRFHPVKLILSTPTAKQKGKRMFRLAGQLIPASGEAIAMELTAAENGSIYLLKLTRPRGNGQDVWAATMKTKMEVLDLQAKAGGRMQLKLSGPLAATLEKGGSFIQWSGEIQAHFDGISE